MFIDHITINPESDNTYTLNINLTNKKCVKNAINQWYDNRLKTEQNTLIIQFNNAAIYLLLPQPLHGKAKLSLIINKKVIDIEYQSLRDLYKLLNKCYDCCGSHDLLTIYLPRYSLVSRIIYGIFGFFFAYCAIGIFMPIFFHDPLKFYRFTYAPTIIADVVNTSLSIFFIFWIMIIMKWILLPANKAKGIKLKIKEVFYFFTGMLILTFFLKMGYTTIGYYFLHSEQSTTGSIEVTFTKKRGYKKYCAGSFEVKELTSNLCIKDYLVLTQIKPGDKAILVGSISPYAIKIKTVLIPKYNYDSEF
jgi:hypothetical protein